MFLECFASLQRGDIRLVGKYIAMSMTQGGHGFPCLAPCVYHYLVSGELTGAVVETSDVPDHQLQVILEKVSVNTPVQALLAVVKFLWIL